MKDVSQTEVPEMWQKVVVAINVVLDCIIKWLFMKMVILEKRPHKSMHESLQIASVSIGRHVCF